MVNKLTETFLSNLDTKQLDSLMEETRINVGYVENILNNVVDSYTESLDITMKNIYNDIIIPLQDEQEVAITTLEKYFLELSNVVYFVGAKVEKLNMYDAMSKIAYKEAYNKNYMNPTIDKQKPTVAELTAFAEDNSLYNQATNEIYNKAYRLCKQKLDNATTMIASISKTISRRMNENQFDNTLKYDSRQVLMENNMA